MIAVLCLLVFSSCASISTTGSTDGQSGERVAPLSAKAGKQARPNISGARVIALGTAQDGGLPHASCGCERCELAHQDLAHSRHVACLGLILENGQRYLFDATPDVIPQLELLRDHALDPMKRVSVNRAPLDGIFLTHAHIGHYLGLAHFGFEAVHTQHLPVYASPRMRSFLINNGPWSQLVQKQNITLMDTDLGNGATLTDTQGPLRIQAFRVPHRDEFSDTLAFRIEGPQHTLLYVPDTDRWTTWSPSLTERLQDVDIALLDGSFYSPDELPGRSIEEIHHPLIISSMDRLQPLVDGGSLQVYFTHLNHSNPALGPDPAFAKEINSRGFQVLSEGQVIEL